VRIAFFGTGQVSATYLAMLASTGYQVVNVVTKQPKRRSRNGAIEATPVARLAEELSIPAITTPKAIDPVAFDVGVVVSYGRLLSPELVRARPLLNVHYSLLPELRGAAPVERSILAGGLAAGVTLMRLVEEMDAGPIYASQPVAIEELGMSEAYERLTTAGVGLLADWLGRGDNWIETEAHAQVGPISYAPKISDGDLVIRCYESALMGYRRHLLERAYLWVQGKRLRVLRAHIEDEADDRVIGSIDERGRIQTAKGMLVPELVRPEGRATMSFLDFLRGTRVKAIDMGPPPVGETR
jgi:methionyl-tRNA formyltransferase